MAQVSRGDLEGLKVLFDRHHKHVYHFLYKMSGDKMLSEDLMQDVFYKVMKYRATYNNGRFVSWLFTIARNSLKSHFKKTKEIYESLDRVADTADDPQEYSEDYSLLYKALARLDESDRELVVMSRFKDIKYAELAEITGSTTGAIKTKISRAMKKLRAIYFEQYEES